MSSGGGGSAPSYGVKYQVGGQKYIVSAPYASLDMIEATL